jgi:hypothetical protein
VLWISGQCEAPEALSASGCIRVDTAAARAGGAGRRCSAQWSIELRNIDPHRPQPFAQFMTGSRARERAIHLGRPPPRDAYLAETAHLGAELAALRGTQDRSALFAQAAAFMRNLPVAWKAANAEQRHAQARLAFQSVEIGDDRVTTVIPQPDFAPFFALADEENDNGQTDQADPHRQGSTLTGGSDGIRTRDLSLDRAAC